MYTNAASVLVPRVHAFSSILTDVYKCCVCFGPTCTRVFLHINNCIQMPREKKNATPQNYIKCCMYNCTFFKWTIRVTTATTILDIVLHIKYGFPNLRHDSVCNMYTFNFLLVPGNLIQKGFKSCLNVSIMTAALACPVYMSDFCVKLSGDRWILGLQQPTCGLKGQVCSLARELGGHLAPTDFRLDDLSELLDVALL